MKRYIRFIALLLPIVLSISCSNESVIEDNDAYAKVYFPSNGFTLRQAWEVEGNKFPINLDVYCSGLREGSKGSIKVGYEVDESLINAYNDDITQEYAGDITLLPGDCYSFADNEIEIPKGEVQGHLQIILDIAKMKAMGMQYNKVQYAIPIRLKSSSSYKLHDSEQMLCTLVGIDLGKPVFYFRENRNGPSPIGVRMMYASEPTVSKQILVSEGVPSDKDYTVNIEPDPDFLSDDQPLLPADAWQLESQTVTFKKGYNTAELAIRFFTDKIAFQKTFYLPLKISSTSEYAADPSRSTLLFKIEVKNDYEWPYVSKMTMTSMGPDGKTLGMGSSLQLQKKTVSTSKDQIWVDMFADESGWYNFMGYYAWFGGDFEIKVTESNDKNKWGVELMATENSPYGFEPTPGKESYFDWDNETFHLFYRFIARDYYSSYWEYIEVEELMEAQHN